MGFKAVNLEPVHGQGGRTQHRHSHMHHVGLGHSKTPFLRLNWDFLEACSCTYKGSLPGNQSVQCLSSEL